jgi:hypothetical protein
MKRNRFYNPAVWLFTLALSLTHAGAAFAESVKPDKVAWANLKEPGYGG